MEKVQIYYKEFLANLAKILGQKETMIQDDCHTKREIAGDQMPVFCFTGI